MAAKRTKIQGQINKNDAVLSVKLFIDVIFWKSND